MQARDTHEVIAPGAREPLPLIGRNGLLITDRKRHDHPGIRPVAQRFEQMLARRFARSFQQIAGAPHQGIDQMRRRLSPDISNGANVAFQHPRLEVESIGIGVAVGSVNLNMQIVESFPNSSTPQGYGYTASY